METRIIACATIKDEINKALEIAGRDYPAVFLKPGLDDEPPACARLLPKKWINRLSRL